MSRRAHLLILPPSGDVFSAPLTANKTEIGSGVHAHVRVADPEVASVHAAVERRDDGSYVLERVAPLTVNGKKPKRHVLGPFDLITLGRTAISFRFGAPAATRPADALALSSLELCRRLNDFSARLVAGASKEELTRRFLADVLALTRGDHGALLRFAGVQAVPVGFVDATSGDFTAEEAQLSSTVVAQLRDANEPLLISDTAADADLGVAPSILESGVRAVMCAPIRHGRHLVGALYVSKNDAPTFTAETLALLTMYAGHASHLLNAAQRDRDLTKRLANTTPAANDRLVGTSPPMQEVRRQVAKFARHDIGILIVGATGTGKEVAAQEIHRQSTRAEGPMVAVNCGAIPHELLQSELFGHVAGAFTHAVTDRQGWLRSAHGGTLFLDEIGEMPLAQQAMLLRVLQTREVTPVGSERSFPVDFRLVCATNRDLQRAVELGSFREDLFYRIADIVVRMPALRDRGDDAVELAHHFLQQQREVLNRPELRLSAPSLSAIRRHEWPGNVRQLEASVRRGALLADTNVVEPIHLGLSQADQAATSSAAEPAILPLSVARDTFLKRYVRDIVRRAGGNRTEAARVLGVTARTVFKYLEEL